MNTARDQMVNKIGKDGPVDRPISLKWGDQGGVNALKTKGNHHFACRLDDGYHSLRPCFQHPFLRNV
jgi:hypothetical protein